MRKIRHFCYSCGMGELWEAGKFSANDCVGKVGKLAIGIQAEGVGKDGKFYPQKNNVRDYINLEGMEGALEQLKERQAIRSQNRQDLPPADAYDDIPM
jgi:hypothetical protein